MFQEHEVENGIRCEAAEAARPRVAVPPGMFAVLVSDGRRGGPGFLAISEPFFEGEEPGVVAALETLRLRGVLRWHDGSEQEFLPSLSKRLCERTYPPASGGAAARKAEGAR